MHLFLVALVHGEVNLAESTGAKLLGEPEVFADGHALVRGGYFPFCLLCLAVIIGNYF